MDRDEAKRVLAEEMGKYRSRSYAALKELLTEIDAYEVKGASGADYQIGLLARICG